MRVLVVSASKHGATREIATAIVRTLVAHGVEAVHADADAALDLADYDAFVVGSGVYAGRWLKDARRFATTHAATLAAHPTWLFSSGPLGAPPLPDEGHAIDATALVEGTGAREHRVFPGRLDRASLGLGERALVVAVRAAEGDFRDWAEIEAWAAGIALTLTLAVPARPVAVPAIG